jgi:microcystin-dependent protein
MSGDELALDFLAALRGPSGAASTPSSTAATLGPRLATVDAAYSGSGSVPVVFDGESAAGVRVYVALAPVLAGQRVVLLPVGHTYVILGATTGGVAGSDLPAGTSIEGHWTAAPSGFYLEDGSVKVRADDAPLFAALGTRYNTGGETSLQFRLPDSRGRVPVGQAASGTFATLGAKGGAETHTLTVTETPSHNHGGSTSSNPAYDTAAIYSDDGAVDFYAHNWDGTFIGNDPTYQNRTIHSHTISSQGGGGSHNNLQPYIVVTRAVKR